MFSRNIKNLNLTGNLRYFKLQLNVKRTFIVSATNSDPIKVQLNKELEQKLEKEELKVSSQ